MTYLAGDPTALQMPTIAVQISFTNPGVPFSWVDIGTYVNGPIRTKSGRNHESQRCETGTADISLDNNDGRFSPWNTASPYWHGGTGLVPNRPVRITATWLGVTYPIWSGYTDAIPITWPSEVESQVVMHCVDDMFNLNQIYLDTDHYDQTVGAQAQLYIPLNDPSGTVQPTCVSTAGYNVNPVLSVAGTPSFGAAAPFLISTETSCDFSQGIGYIQTSPVALASGSVLAIEVWLRANAPPATGFGCIALGLRPDGGPADFEVTVDTSGFVHTTTAWSTVNSTVNVCDGNWHHIVAIMSFSASVASRTYVDNVLTASSAAVAAAAPIADYVTINGPFFTPFALMAKFGVYTATAALPISTAQIANHFAIGSTALGIQSSGTRIEAALGAAAWQYSSGYPNIDLGNSLIQAATTSLALSTLLSYIQQVEATEAGAFYSGPDGPGDLIFRERHYPLINPTSKTSQGTFADSTSGVAFNYLGQKTSPAMDSLDMWTQASVSRTNGVNQTWTDQNAANTYGLRHLPPMSGLLMTTDAEALARAQWTVAHYSTPQTRLRSLTIDSLGKGGANFPQMLGRILFDRITVDRQAPDGSSLFSQDGLIEQISHEINIDSWITTWVLATPDTQRYLVLDDPVFGRLDSANHLAY